MLIKQNNDQHHQLYYKLGLCNLYEFSQYRSKYGIFFKIEELMWIFYKLMEFIIFMYENDYFHGDLKPLNIVLVELK